MRIDGIRGVKERKGENGEGKERFTLLEILRLRMYSW